VSIARVLVVLAVLTVLGSVVAIVVQNSDGADPGLDDSREDRFTAYCDEVGRQQQALSDALAQGETTGLLAALPSFEALEAEAPDDIADEWGTVVRRVTVLRDALDDAGVDPATYDPEKPPPGVTRDQRVAITAAANGLSDPTTQQAFQAVQQQVRDVCGTPLTL
jgi:hypothetical protein